MSRNGSTTKSASAGLLKRKMINKLFKYYTVIQDNHDQNVTSTLMNATNIQNHFESDVEEFCSDIINRAAKSKEIVSLFKNEIEMFKYDYFSDQKKVDKNMKTLKLLQSEKKDLKSYSKLSKTTNKKESKQTSPSKKIVNQEEVANILQNLVTGTYKDADLQEINKLIYKEEY